jgi:hypothetical protein
MKGTESTCFSRVSVDAKISRFSNNAFLKADTREGKGLEYMIVMWEEGGHVGVPQRSCQVQKDAVQVRLLGCKA